MGASRGRDTQNKSQLCASSVQEKQQGDVVREDESMRSSQFTVTSQEVTWNVGANEDVEVEETKEEEREEAMRTREERSEGGSTFLAVSRVSG